MSAFTGAMTLITMTLSITTLRIQGSFGPLSIDDTQYDNTPD